MATLTSALRYSSSSSAIILPETSLSLSYGDVKRHIDTLQSSLAEVGVSPRSAVTLSLVNGLEFAISFLAVSAQRAIAAPLNPSYQESEIEFYVDDIKAVLMIVPQDAVKANSPAVRAARKFGVGIAEIGWDGQTVRLVLKEKGKYLKPYQAIVRAEPDDIAV